MVHLKRMLTGLSIFSVAIFLMILSDAMADWINIRFDSHITGISIVVCFFLGVAVFIVSYIIGVIVDFGTALDSMRETTDAPPPEDIK